MIGVEERGDVAVVTLAHGKVNALDLELLLAASQTMRDLQEAGAVVVTGAGRAFSAGVDLKRIADGGEEYVAAFLPAMRDAFLAFYDFPRPVVAAVNGHAIAGGCVIAAACDVRLMSGGTIGLTELLVGVAFPTAPLEVVRHAFGPAANRMVITGETFGPDRAKELGIVDEVVAPDELVPEAVRRAETLATIPREVYALTKERLHRETRARIEAGQVADDPAAKAVWESPRTRAAITAYLDALAGL